MKICQKLKTWSKLDVLCLCWCWLGSTVQLSCVVIVLILTRCKQQTPLYCVYVWCLYGVHIEPAKLCDFYVDADRCRMTRSHQETPQWHSPALFSSICSMPLGADLRWVLSRQEESVQSVTTPAHSPPVLCIQTLSLWLLPFSHMLHYLRFKNSETLCRESIKVLPLYWNHCGLGCGTWIKKVAVTASPSKYENIADVKQFLKILAV